MRFQITLATTAAAAMLIAAAAARGDLGCIALASLSAFSGANLSSGVVDRRRRNEIENATAAAYKRGSSTAENASQARFDEIMSEHKRALDRAANEAATGGYERATRLLNLEHSRNVSALKADHEQALASLTRELQATRNQCDELSGRIANHRTEQAKLDRDRGQLKREQESLEKFKNQLTELRLNYKHQGEQARRDQGTIAALRSRLSDLEKAIRSEHERGIKVGAADQLKADEDRLARADLEIATLKAKLTEMSVLLDRRRRAAKFEESLPALDKALGSPKPLLIIGSQGSGKALTLANALSAFAGGEPILPVVLDISEARDPDSSWSRLGVPATDNPELFLRFVERLVTNLESRAHRNNRAAYDSQPWIFPIIDEALCAFDSLTKEDIEGRLAPSLRALESRGHKRKVLPCLLTQNAQIQNLKARGVSTWNTGVLSNFTHIRLNDALASSITIEDTNLDPALAAYLEINEGKFIACIEKDSARGRVKIAIKHPSHHGQSLIDTCPRSGITGLELAAPPAYFPREIASLFGVSAWGGNGEAAVSLTNLDQPESPPALDCDEVATPSTPADLAKQYGLTSLDVSAILDAIDDGLTMSKTCTEAINATKNSKRYRAARSLYQSLTA
ncbi:MAG: hypothetical protein HC795_12980 [Coleofasciculaceae cyanobacterium RL_1_1]|nr:hypothetical protein [Coleofasciculaceae cyanobacterium RL_1_1]